MERLNGFDAQLIASESKRSPFHIAHFRIYDPSSAPDPVVRFKKILQCFEERLHMSPLFRKQLVKVPFNLDNPYWIESPDFNIETHVRHIGLPQPGDWRQLCILIARLHSQPINMRRPLWEAYVIEGLDNIDGAPKGAFGVLIKMHHAICDGMVADAMLEAIHDKHPEPKAIEASDWKPEPKPSTQKLLRQTVSNYVKQPARSVKSAAKIISSIRRGREYQKDNPRNIKQNETCIFNESVTANKVWGAVLANLSDLKTIKNSVPGATINDASLAITSFAVEKYLSHHGSMVDESLKTAFAVNTRSMSEYNDGYNNSVPIFQSTHSNISDPLQRLAAIHNSTDEGKQHLETIGPDRLRNIFEATPSVLVNVGLQLADRFELMANQTIGAHYFLTNVPGPREERYLAGARALISFGIGLIMDGNGLCHVVSSYEDKLTISFTCCRNMMPDPNFYNKCLYDSLELMLEAAKQKSAS